jgi:hypothetical protein
LRGYIEERAYDRHRSDISFQEEEAFSGESSKIFTVSDFPPYVRVTSPAAEHFAPTPLLLMAQVASDFPLFSTSVTGVEYSCPFRLKRSTGKYGETSLLLLKPWVFFDVLNDFHSQPKLTIPTVYRGVRSVINIR